MSRGYGTMAEGTTPQHSEDVTSLTNIVAENILIIKTNTSAIEKATKVIGTPQDSAEYRENA